MASVILVHGIRTSSTMWRGQSERLAEAGIPHLAVDLPGHGARAGQPFALAACRDVLDDAVASLPEPHVVVGLSLGSYVAIDWAATGAGSTAPGPAAMLLASCGTRPRGIGLASYLAAARIIGRTPDRGLGLHTWMARRVLDRQAVADILAGGVAVDTMVPALRAIRAIDVEGALARVEYPIWFVNGARDHLRVEERRLLRSAPRATLAHVPRAGHIVALDRPEMFARLVLEVVRHADAALPRMA